MEGIDPVQASKQAQQGQEVGTALLKKQQDLVKQEGDAILYLLENSTIRPASDTSSRLNILA